MPSELKHMELKTVTVESIEGLIARYQDEIGVRQKLITTLNRDLERQRRLDANA